MAMKSEYGKYLTLEDVRVFYDAKNDSIHLTSKDKDLPKGHGFRLTLNKGRYAESVLRELLEQAGLIPEEKTAPLPDRMIRLDEAQNTAAWKLPLGVGINDTEITLDLKKDGHCVVTGATGSGKSVILRNFLFHCFQHPNDFEVVAVDMKVVNFKPYMGMSPVLKTVAVNLEETQELLLQLESEMMSRYQLMSNAEVTEISELLSPPKRILVIIDEAAFLIPEQQELKDTVSAIIRLGRAAGVHLCLASQLSSSSMVSEYLRTDHVALISMDTSKVGASISKAYGVNYLRGVGHFKEASGAWEDFRAYYADMDWWNRRQ